MESIDCPLCSGTSSHYHTQRQREFLQCSLCLSVFTHPDNYLTSDEEKAHYECHNNDPADIRYQNFLSPAINAVLRDYNQSEKGLDFGSGTGSPIVKVLSDNGYNINQYDIFFHNDPEKLNFSYDYITCTEVAEHFKEPLIEFKALRNMLKPNGKLYVMTDMFDENRDFATWYYKTDLTHVFLYHPKAFEWIKDNIGFKNVTFDKRLIVLES
ncbi:class I SAM-dependent methyltransferase [Flavobacterium sp. DG1-102-2]|uniref:class I SAM-dependent methyltransferase n=1 Tax=Flavobacterium sp. DG1-102-2 TaxID=3081663 RepID=UPI0029491C8A|nr:class I SAM-dependent methyltransferase [Flavobacterium sp. DG1-102-2]MDV6167982.1 class I SAM-dependent methyltransferase [Flavobacterium sp. DG1-102-2]